MIAILTLALVLFYGISNVATVILLRRSRKREKARRDPLEQELERLHNDNNEFIDRLQRAETAVRLLATRQCPQCGVTFMLDVDPIKEPPPASQPRCVS